MSYRKPSWYNKLLNAIVQGKLEKYWHKYRFCYNVPVIWPKGPTRPDHLGNQSFSTDPNEHWRPWMELHVGRQGWDWDWELINGGTALNIKFHSKKMALLFALVWA